jgi:RluA family pseudouridine synthase
MQIEIIYQDGRIIVINKPAGLSVTKDRNSSVWLLDLLEKQMAGTLAEKIRLVHRLDKETSGVMILAKSKDAQRQFTGYFERRLVKKTYLALVRGRTESASGVIDVPIGPKKEAGQLMCIKRKGGRYAVTEWQILADFGGVLLLMVRPLTGRTHQIRMHLSSIGLHIIADKLYGNSGGLYLSEFKSDYRLGWGQTEKPLINRLALHAYSIEFSPAFSNESKSGGRKNLPEYFIAPLDKKFKAAIKMLTKYNRKGVDAFADPDVYQKIMSNTKINC